MTSKITVSQADREQSWPIYKWAFDDAADERHHMEGDNDEHFIVQAFARHRIQSTLSPTGEVGELISALSDIADDHDAKGDHWKANRVREATTALEQSHSREEGLWERVGRLEAALDDLQLSAQRVANKYGRDPVTDELLDWHEWGEVRDNCAIARTALTQPGDQP